MLQYFLINNDEVCQLEGMDFTRYGENWRQYFFDQIEQRDGRNARKLDRLYHILAKMAQKGIMRTVLTRPELAKILDVGESQIREDWGKWWAYLQVSFYDVEACADMGNRFVGKFIALSPYKFTTIEELRNSYGEEMPLLPDGIEEILTYEEQVKRNLTRGFSTFEEMLEAHYEAYTLELDYNRLPTRAAEGGAHKVILDNYNKKKG